MLNHIHMLVSIPPKINVSSFKGDLKGKSALMIFDKYANLKYKYGNGLNEVKASVFRRCPVTKAYSRRANHPLDGWC